MFKENVCLTVNPPKRVALASFFAGLVFVVLIFVPEFLGVDGMAGGFALSFVFFFLAICAFVVFAFYFGFARKVDAILAGKGVLVHWTYAEDYWLDYAKKEYVEEKSEKRGLFLVVCGFALFFGVLFWVFDAEAGFYVFLVMLGLIGVCAFAWRFSAWYTYRQNISGVKEVYVTRDAVYLNRRLYAWSTVLAFFDEVAQKDNDGLALLVFKYTIVGRAGPQTYNVRVPVPRGQEEVAKNIVLQINRSN